MRKDMIDMDLEVTNKIDNYLKEYKKYTGYEQKEAQEIKIWADSLNWAADQLKVAEYDNALKGLEQTKKAIPMLIKSVKKMQKEMKS